LNAPDTAEFSINGRDEQAEAISSFRTDLKIYRNGGTGPELIFRGRILETGDDIDEDTHTVTVPAVDYRGWLERRIVYVDRTLTNMTQYNLAWELVRGDAVGGAQYGPGGNLNIARGPWVGNLHLRDKVRTHVVEAGQSIPDALDAVSNLWEGFEWWITPPPSGVGLSFYTGWRGRDAIDLPLVYGTTVRTVSRTLNVGEYANSIRVSGGSENQQTPAPSAIVIVPDIESRVEGRMAVQIGDNDRKTQALVDAFAQGELYRRGTIVPAYKFGLKPNIYDGGDSIAVGDRADFRVRSGRLDVVGNDRVHTIDVAITDDGTEVVDVTMSTIREGLLLLLKKTPERLERLERR
jgi:hypothetical protein